MHVLVVGAGAVGTFLGATLAAGGCEVTLVDRAPEPAASTGVDAELADRHASPAVATAPTTMLVVERNREQRAVAARRIESIDELDRPPQVALVAAKMFDLAAAIEPLRRWPDLALLTVQNGIGAEDVACDTHPGPVLAGSLTSALELRSPGRVRRMREGGIGLAPVRGDVGATIERLVGAFTAGGLRARAFPDHVAMKWSKLLGNLVGNATSAVLDLEPAAVYADPRLFAVERSQILETLAVMAGLGRSPIALPGADARLVALAFRAPAVVGRLAMVRVAGGARGGKWPSLALHVRAGRGLPTEVPWLNGAVARAGAGVGVRATVNATLARLVDEVAADPGRRDWYRGQPDRLVEQIGRAASAA